MGIPRIIFEDDQLLVLDKPAGMVTVRAKTSRAKTVQNWLEAREILRYKVPTSSLAGRGSSARRAGNTKRPKVSDFFKRSGIVHRLDKETSGLLLVAKAPGAFHHLQGQFRQRKVEKKYLALVHGRVVPQKGAVEASIARSPFDRKKFGVFLGGREAKSRYKVISNWLFPPEADQPLAGVVRNKREEFSLLEVAPTTGRTHQIRVHLKHIDHPVVGDLKYAGRKTARRDREWCPRQFLHASFLALKHPKTNQTVRFESPLPEGLKKVLDILSHDEAKTQG